MENTDIFVSTDSPDFTILLVFNIIKFLSTDFHKKKEAAVKIPKMKMVHYLIFQSIPQIKNHPYTVKPVLTTPSL